MYKRHQGHIAETIPQNYTKEVVITPTSLSLVIHTDIFPSSAWTVDTTLNSRGYLIFLSYLHTNVAKLALLSSLKHTSSCTPAAVRPVTCHHRHLFNCRPSHSPPSVHQIGSFLGSRMRTCELTVHWHSRGRMKCSSHFLTSMIYPTCQMFGGARKLEVGCVGNRGRD